MLWKRVLSAIILIPVVCLLIYAGGWYLNTAVIIISLVGLYEIINVFIKNSALSKINIVSLLTYLVSTLFLILTGLGIKEALAISIFLFIILGGIAIVSGHKTYDIIILSGMAFCFLYVPFMLSHLMLLRSIKGIGFSLTWLCFLCTWGTDTFAYATGLTMGKHKLCPNVSAKKTIEGAVGGFLGGTIVCIIWAFVSVKYLNVHMDNIYIKFGLIGIIGSIISQFGDLTASIIKRKYSVKDYGNIIPGHGGILDRFDSLIFMAPFVFYFISYIKF